MTALSVAKKKMVHLAMVPVLAAVVGVAVAQEPPRHDDHGQDRGHQGDNRDDRDYRDHGDHGDHGGSDRGDNFHFRDQDRGNFQSHYGRDIDRWRRNPGGRPQFVRGQRIPSNYRFQAVPRSYYRNVPPPPVGYQYGYYDGYVVAYNPTSRIIADVLDLVAAAASR